MICQQDSIVLKKLKYKSNMVYVLSCIGMFTTAVIAVVYFMVVDPDGMLDYSRFINRHTVDHLSNIDTLVLLSLIFTDVIYLLIIRIYSRMLNDTDYQICLVKDQLQLECDLKTVIAATAYHEMSTPIAVVNTTAQTLLDDDAVLSNPVLHKHVKLIDGTIKRLDAVLDQMSLDRGLQKQEQLPLSEMLDNTLKSLQLINTEFEFEYTITNRDLLDITTSYKLNTGTVCNILNNLFKNSLDAGATRIMITANINKRMIDIIIMDNGGGIPKENMSSIFILGISSKTNWDNVGHNDNGGSGLYLVKTIVDSVGGRVLLTSTSKSGTSFKLTIPMKTIKQRSHYEL